MGEHPTTGRDRERERDDDLWSLLREREFEGELLVYRACFLLASTGLLLPLLSSLLSGDGARNISFFLIAAIYAVWFGVAVLLKKREIAPRLVRGVSIVLYALVPWAIMGAYVSLLGILRAIGVWEPIIFFTAMCVLSILWARPSVPLAIGAVGAISYLVLWFVTTPPATWASLDKNSPLVPYIAVYRAGLLLFIGGLCWWGARRFKRSLLEGAHALRARDLFGKYRLHHALGHGGMGSVVKATYCPEGGFERPVAIKRVLQHIASKPEVVAQFRAEAELGSRLVHPNIVAVLDFGRVEHEYFFAMEYVDGPSLQQVLSRARKSGHPLPPSFTARVMLDVCAALQFAHEEAVDGEGRPLRVVHRDLCPANILIARAGTVKLTDFGIARVLGDAEAEQTSTVVGKVAYMAPELLTRESFDARADIFSLGVILWEMLTGQRLFQRSRHGAAALAVAEDNVPLPSSLRADLDPAWDAICARCLQPEAEQRYASVRELQQALLARARAAQNSDGNEVRMQLEALERATGRAWRGIEDADDSASGSAPPATLATESVTERVAYLATGLDEPADVTDGER